MTASYRIPLCRPSVTAATRERVCAVLDSGFLTEGAVTREFENAVQKYLGGGHVLATTSCTTGLELALRAVGIGPGDEVIVPDFTYPATADVVAIVGATPVLVDVDPRTMVINPDAANAAITARTRAIIAVSAFGNPCDYRRLNAIKQTHDLIIIEDAAPALGASYEGVAVGRLADISVFSLHPRKFITTGEGGLVVTDNARWAAWMNSYKRFGMETDGERPLPSFVRIGTNFKLSDILSAVGLEQMSRIEPLLARRRALAARYIERLRDLPGVALPDVTPGGVHAYQSFCILVDRRDQLLKAMREQGIEVQIGTFALHREPVFAVGGPARIAGSLTGSALSYERSLALPLYDALTEEDQDTVVAALSAAIAETLRS